MGTRAILPRGRGGRLVVLPGRRGKPLNFVPAFTPSAAAPGVSAVPAVPGGGDSDGGGGGGSFDSEQEAAVKYDGRSTIVQRLHIMANAVLGRRA